MEWNSVAAFGCESGCVVQINRVGGVRESDPIAVHVLMGRLRTWVFRPPGSWGDAERMSRLRQSTECEWKSPEYRIPLLAWSPDQFGDTMKPPKQGADAWPSLPQIDPLQPEHVGYVQRLVSKFATDASLDREDLVQNALVQALHSRKSPLDPEALLFGIVRRIVGRWRRRQQQRRRALYAVEKAQATEGLSETTEEQWQVAEQVAVVHEAIDDLPDLFRDVFIRCELEGMTMPAYAADLKISVDTGYTRLRLARTRFEASVRRILARRRLGHGDI